MPAIIYFVLSLAALVLGYFFYGRLVERAFRPDRHRQTPALAMTDGVDYTPLPAKEIFLNQFLSISGIGPVFGAIMGALYGPAALLWIVMGCIFAGGVHDYMSGMISIRYRGESIPDVVGRILGPGFKIFMRIFSLILLILVGVVFVLAPAALLDSLTRVENDLSIWAALIFTYYFFATILPIEVIVSRFTPFFTVVLSVMAVGVIGALMLGDYNFYNWAEWKNTHPEGLPIWPLMFITIACGAISGFHATQSPISARCLENENLGRKIFYGAMIMEGVIALIWATAAMTLYNSSAELQAALNSGGPSGAVGAISLTLLGELGGMLAVLGVVVLPITSGDTAFRASRLIVANTLKMDQKKGVDRLKIAVPLFAVGIALTQVDFEVIWRYFAWSNQTLATIVLWAGAAYLVRLGSCHWIATIPAVFMTMVVVTYILHVDLGGKMPYTQSVIGGILAAVLALTVFMLSRQRFRDKVPAELVPLVEPILDENETR